MFKLVVLSIAIASQATPALAKTADPHVAYKVDNKRQVIRVIAEDGTQFVFDLKRRQQFIVFPDNSVTMRLLDAHGQDAP